MTPDLQTLRLTVLELTGWTDIAIRSRYNGIQDYDALCGLTNEIMCECPDPTASLSDCEPLLEEMNKSGSISINNWYKNWTIGFHDDNDRVTYLAIESPTLSVATCLVFIKWKEGKRERLSAQVES